MIQTVGSSLKVKSSVEINRLMVVWECAKEIFNLNFVCNCVTHQLQILVVFILCLSSFMQTLWYTMFHLLYGWNSYLSRDWISNCKLILCLLNGHHCAFCHYLFIILLLVSGKPWSDFLHCDSLWCYTARNIYKSFWYMGKGNWLILNKSRMHQDGCWKQSWQGITRVL